MLCIAPECSHADQVASKLAHNVLLHFAGEAISTWAGSDFSKLRDLRTALKGATTGERGSLEYIKRRMEVDHFNVKRALVSCGVDASSPPRADPIGERGLSFEQCCCLNAVGVIHGAGMLQDVRGRMRGWADRSAQFVAKPPRKPA